MIVAVTALAASSPRAQQGKVSGRVVDEATAPFGFADVFLVGEGNAYSKTAMSNEDGSFSFFPVPPGRYRLHAFATGLVSDTLTGIVVSPGSVGAYTVQLRQAGAAIDTVHVHGDRMVDPTIIDLQIVLDGDFIDELPLLTRDIEGILAMLPGVTHRGPSESSDVSIGGGTGGQIEYIVDDMTINDSMDGGKGHDIPTAAIEQLKLTITGSSAQHVQRATGVVEVATKRGKDVFEVRYATSFRDTRVGAQRIGGLPSVQAFVDELLRGEGTILEGEMKRGFELLGVEATSTRADDNDPPPRHRTRHTLSAGGPIVPKKLYFHSTIETLADDYGSAFARGLQQTDQILFLGKLNWDASEANKAEATLSLDVADHDGFVALRGGESLATFASEGSWTLTLKDDHVFGPRALLESRLSLGHDSERTRPADERTGVGPRFSIPLPPGGPTSYVLGSPGVTFDQTADEVRLQEKYTRTFDLADTSHVLEVGGHWSSLSFESYTERGPDVTDFRIIEDSFTSAQSPPDLMGRVVDHGPPVRTGDSTWSASAFVQDKWLVTRNFTLDAGIGATYQEFVGDVFFAPRVGFALDPIGDRNTVFRGNWGIYYDSFFANALQHVRSADRFYSDIHFADAFTRRKFSETPITRVYKEALVTGYDPTDGDALAYMRSLVHDRFRLGENLSAPTNKQWSFDLQRALPARMSLRVSYTENKRTHQLREDVRTVALPVRQNQFEVRDRILNTSGEGRFHAWSVALQKSFAESWAVNFSYTQSRNSGPIPPPADAVDPGDVLSENGILGNDRTHVVKVQGHGRLPGGIVLSGDFAWSTGEPLSAEILTSTGATLRPLGRNTLRYPSFRALNVRLARSFKPRKGPLDIRAELTIFNVLDQLNVHGGFGRFELPEGYSRNPESFPPLRPSIVPTAIDLGRCAELGLTLTF